jgi:hypothetical protein
MLPAAAHPGDGAADTMTEIPTSRSDRCAVSPALERRPSCIEKNPEDRTIGAAIAYDLEGSGLSIPILAPRHQGASGCRRSRSAQPRRSCGPRDRVVRCNEAPNGRSTARKT